jgi:flagellar motility protein MotE (MotC chaperone)
MKPMLIYAGVFFGSLIVATEAVLMVVPRRTEGLKPKAAVTQIKPLARRPAGESVSHDTATATPQDSAASVARDSAALQDSVTLLRTQLELERKKAAALSDRPPSGKPVADTLKTKDKKSVAKLLEGMDAQGVAQILRTMDDTELKEILLLMKKRQAGKILSSLDPERVARLLR